MTDDLHLTDPLTGYIMLGGEREDAVPAVLRDTGTRIELSVPFRDIRTVPGCWFVSSWRDSNGGLVVGNQIPDSLPHELLFVCNARSFVLVGCRSSGMSMSVGFGPGTGKVIPTYVVCGGRHGRYAEINGLRTRCLDSVRWFDLSSTSLLVTKDEEGKCKNVKVCSSAIPPVDIDKQAGLVIRPDFEVTESGKTDSIISRQSVLIETKKDCEMKWEEHLSVHHAIKDLISISDWNSREFTDMSVMRLDDPKLVIDGKIVYEGWFPVISYYPLVQRNGVDNIQDTFIFSYRDIGIFGIKKWLSLRQACSQGMTLLSYLAREHQHLALETLSILVGTALECVAWYVATTERDVYLFQRNKRNRMLRFVSYEKALTCVVEKFGSFFPFNDSTRWRFEACKTFMGNKHPDAKSSDFQTMYQTTMQSLIILRMWLGIQLGANVAEMKKRLYRDEIGKNIRDLLI
ncbi:hypothetical protein JS528_00100 [Bifidobacterium sp. MA2]|uniref:ApeA N-terminal domain-containing protein n=1 Tax=Bifidobacterium santillanense TaxID=2809028 RepID=A0ABS5ULK0_9BIFI|nr:hypothetical protein [Bifidobacterium santillanense]MBT1171786.1 hypothetical protein [Bifidobacterium santillanense]